MIPDLAEQDQLEALLTMLRRHKVYKFRAGELELEMDRQDPLTVDEDADPGVQIQQLEAVVARRREEIERRALVDEFGAG